MATTRACGCDMSVAILALYQHDAGVRNRFQCHVGGATVSRSIEARSSGWFIDATVETGLDFMHVNGMTGEFYYPKSSRPA
jgi:hypothetical protein